ncbi:hypothetical protein VPIG_00046 [Vibrio phage PWH3a-P1]|uniref:hypothetical protein n=1 Tax=Vibrio phage PWH3a-P1 TaxID=754058 RepID=UPI0002C081A6|nr:hypothetical protein VPIG_00046 [Vibrio phage PWH3a-P1]AGH31904.1 hypothetical protein VPIG_00046 [Vibrio phage PWH3a-P1]
MQLDLPKWLCEELNKDTNRSIQTYIKGVLIEYVNNSEWREIGKEIERNKEGGRGLGK